MKMSMSVLMACLAVLVVSSYATPPVTASGGNAQSMPVAKSASVAPEKEVILCCSANEAVQFAKDPKGFVARMESRGGVIATREKGYFLSRSCLPEINEGNDSLLSATPENGGNLIERGPNWTTIGPGSSSLEPMQVIEGYDYLVGTD